MRRATAYPTSKETRWTTRPCIPKALPSWSRYAKDLNCTVDELIKSKELRSRIDIKKYVTPTVGLPTLTDIMQELDKPGRDPRQQIQVFEFDKNVKTIEDLTEGMELPGIVNNITNFGCFVDIGIKERLWWRYHNWPTNL